MNKKDRYEAVIKYFENHMPAADTELNYESPFQLLVAVILSAQCTDKRVNLVTPELFKQFPTPEVLAESSAEEVFPYIKSISYPNNKAKHLVGMAKMLVHEFNGEIPDDVGLLQKMPGVGRKTANVISSVIFNRPALAVDTHVFRVSSRIGLTYDAKTPLAAERQLVQHIPKAKIAKAHHWLILHGRYVCLARTPKCQDCGITNFCRFYRRKHMLRH